MSLTPTPVPTGTDVLNALPHTGGRITAAWNAMLALLHEQLPAVITLANSTWGLHLPKVKGYIVAGEKAPEEGPWIEIAAVPSGQTMSPVENRDTSHVVIHVAYPAPLTRQSVDNASDICCLIRALLYYYRGPYADAAGRDLWSGMMPTGIDLGPQDFTTANFSGCALHLTLEQYPQESMWAPGSATPTVAPTAQHVLDGLPFCGGRLSLARNGVMELLHKTLLPALVAANSAYGLHLPVPTTGEDVGMYALGEVVRPKTPLVVVGAGARTEPAGLQVFSDTLEMTVHCLFAREEVRSGLDNPTDFSNLVRAALWYGLRGFVTAAGLQAWDTLVFNSTAVQQDQQNLLSVRLSYTALQGPNALRWG